MKSTILFFTITFIFSAFSYAAPTSLNPSKTLSLKSQKPSFKSLKKTFFAHSNELEKSWHIVLLMGKVYPQASKSFLQSLIKHKKWYVRSAALNSLAQFHKKEALESAKILLKDPALMVRAAGVKIIKDLKGFDLNKELWTAFDSKNNFRNGKSLWIRKLILETLVDFKRPSNAVRFVKVLKGVDHDLHKTAVSGLEKIRGYELPSRFNLEQKRLSLIHDYQNISL